MRPDQLGYAGIQRRELITVVTPHRDEADAKPVPFAWIPAR